MAVNEPPHKNGNRWSTDSDGVFCEWTYAAPVTPTDNAANDRDKTTGTVKLNDKLAAKAVVCVYIDDGGIYHKGKADGTKNADGTFTFKTGHFSSYAIMAADEAGRVIANQTEQSDTLIKELKLTVRTSKTSKKSIRAAVTGDVKALTDAARYVNTAGTKYYYKVRAYVYD